MTTYIEALAMYEADCIRAKVAMLAALVGFVRARKIEAEAREAAPRQCRSNTDFILGELGKAYNMAARGEKL